MSRSPPLNCLPLFNAFHAFHAFLWPFWNLLIHVQPRSATNDNPPSTYSTFQCLTNLSFTFLRLIFSSPALPATDLPATAYSYRVFYASQAFLGPFWDLFIHIHIFAIPSCHLQHFFCTFPCIFLSYLFIFQHLLWYSSDLNTLFVSLCAFFSLFTTHLFSFCYSSYGLLPLFKPFQLIKISLSLL